MQWWGYIGLWAMLFGPPAAVGVANLRALLRDRSWHRHVRTALEVAR